MKFHWHKNRYINGIEDPDISLHTYGYLIQDKECRNTYYKKTQHLQQMLLVKLDGTMQKKANRCVLITCARLNSIWIKDLTQYDRKESKEQYWHRKRLSQQNTNNLAIKNNNKWDLTKPESFFMEKYRIIWTKQQATEFEKTQE